MILFISLGSFLRLKSSFSETIFWSYLTGKPSFPPLLPLSDLDDQINGQ